MEDKSKAVKIGRVAKRMRLAVFQDRDPIYSRRLKRFTKRFAPPHWTAFDLTSYHVGCGKDAAEAVRRLIAQIHATLFIIADEEAKGVKVIQWDVPLPEKEAKDAEDKAKKNGFILESVEMPPMPKSMARWIGKAKWTTVKKGS